ncbi:MAG: sulfotransferase [Robiginitomaculum sp.]
MNDTPQQNKTTSATDLKTVQKTMQAGDFNAALVILDDALKAESNNMEALYMTAVCHRYTKKYGLAQETLNTLKSISPEFGRAYQEQGHLYRAQGQTENSLEAFMQACRMNSALSASWIAQAQILLKQGKTQAANNAKAQADRLSKLPRELVTVTSYISEGKYLKAENLCRYFLQKNPHHIEAMRLLADIGSRLGILEDADFLLESALEFEPENIQLRLDYAQLLRKRQKFTQALAQAKSLYDKDPNSPVFQSHYAIECMQTGDFDKAFELFEQVLKKLPNDTATLTSRGHALKTYGRQDEAITSYQAAIASKPNHGDAYYSLSNLKTYQFTDAELAAMQKQESRENLEYRNRIHFCFALGKAFEDLGDYEQSFSYYERGNKLKRIQSRYDASKMDEEFTAQSDICSRSLFEQHKGHGHQAPDPIFIVGLPRAGSTLLEQILASHSQVDGTLELPNILALSHRLRGRKRVSKETLYPKNLFDMSAKRLEEFGLDYIENTEIHRKGAAFFTDKMPNNFRHIGLIHLILPNAKIIDARRDPLSCCFSGFKQLFAEGQEFTYGLEQIGRYYKGYVELMRHWDTVLPGKILRVQYEDVVADLEPQVRRILDHCGLPFEQSCVDFHKSKREVRTASSEQVRQPINTKGLAQWKHFEPYLDELKQALGDSLMGYRD